MGRLNNTKQKKMCCHYLPKINTSAFDIKKFSNNYLRVLINKFTLDGLVSHVTFISMGKTENNEYEIECASDLVEL